MFLRKKYIIPLFFTTHLIIPFPQTHIPFQEPCVLYNFCWPSLVFRLRRLKAGEGKANLHTYLHYSTPAPPLLRRLQPFWGGTFLQLSRRYVLPRRAPFGFVFCLNLLRPQNKKERDRETLWRLSSSVPHT